MPEDTHDTARAMSRRIAPPTTVTRGELQEQPLQSLIPGGLETNQCRRHTSLYIVQAIPYLLQRYKYMQICQLHMQHWGICKPSHSFILVQEMKTPSFSHL